MRSTWEIMRSDAAQWWAREAWIIWGLVHMLAWVVALACPLIGAPMAHDLKWMGYFWLSLVPLAIMVTQAVTRWVLRARARR